jgi:tetratricopeptide (TPR) repeat protein
MHNRSLHRKLTGANMDAVQAYKAGEELKNSGKHDEAVAQFQAALQADPSYVLAHHALAVCYSHVGEHDKAVHHAQQACELEPQDAFSFMSLSVTFRRAFQGTGDHRYIQLAEDAMARSHALSGR